MQSSLLIALCWNNFLSVFRVVGFCLLTKLILNRRICDYYLLRQGKFYSLLEFLAKLIKEKNCLFVGLLLLVIMMKKI